MNRVHILFFILISLFFSCEKNEEPQTTISEKKRTIEPTHTVDIRSESSEHITEVNVALAQTDEETMTGLMHVHELPFDTGMFFIFDNEIPRHFWMVNTPLSLDIIFISSENRIVRIHPRATPYSDRRIYSVYPAKYVLEVNAGFANQYDIREGMYVKLKQEI